MEARNELIDLVAKRDGVHRAAFLAKSWIAERPGHDRLEELYYRQLTRSQAPAASQYALLKRRVQRNPEDAWAWRELGFSTIYKYSTAAETGQKRIARRMDVLLRSVIALRRLIPPLCGSMQTGCRPAEHGQSQWSFG